MTMAASFSEIVEAVREQTALLLGTTISYDAADWAEPTPLRGWTRSHVAAHLVEGALDMQHRLSSSAGESVYRSDADRQIALETRALSPELELQIQLDETAGALQPLLAAAKDDDRMLTMGQGWSLPANMLPVLRLRELTIHHFDLLGTLVELPDEILKELLLLETTRPQLAEVRPVLLLTDDGFSERIGSGNAAPTTVIGPAQDLLLWLARGIVGANISGARDVELPENP